MLWNMFEFFFRVKIVPGLDFLFIFQNEPNHIKLNLILNYFVLVLYIVLIYYYFLVSIFINN